MDRKRLGSANISPAGDFPAGSCGTWTVTHIVGDCGIDDGGSIAIARRAMCDGSFPQTENPKAAGYTTVSVESRGDAKFRAFYDKGWWVRPWRGCFVVHFFDGSLFPGDKVRVTFGDRCEGSSGWQLQTFPETTHSFKVLVDATGSREYYEVERSPEIRIVPAEPVQVDAVLPSVIRPGEPCSATIRLMDRFGNPSGDGVRTVRLDPVGLVKSGLSAELQFASGIVEFGGIILSTEGSGRFRVVVDGIEGQSNPFKVSREDGPVFWADVHGQTRGTIGTGSVEEYFRFARRKAVLDVAGWQGNDFQVTDALWAEVCRQTERLHEAGRFVTFLGYEWSGPTPVGGDHNILFLNDDQPIHRSSHWQIHDGSSEESDRRPISKLWEEFKGRPDVMAVAHVGGRYANLDFCDPDIVRLVEIHSHHGTFEWLAEDALRRGLRVGFVGQSDDHSGRPGWSAPLGALAADLATFDVWGGLTGIFAKELTREAVWEALRSRHCYATSGRRILLKVTAGEHMMGDVVRAKEMPEMCVEVVGTAPLLDIEIRRDADVIHHHPFDQDRETDWIRVQWSGVRIRSRNKRTHWNGTLSVLGGRIEEFRPFAFDREDEGVERVSESELKIRSTTAGDVDGVFLKVSRPDARLFLRTDVIEQEVTVSEITADPLIFDAGGVNQQLRFVRSTPRDRPVEARMTFRDTRGSEGKHACWVKVVQLDGHMAWSSPVFFEPIQ